MSPILALALCARAADVVVYENDFDAYTTSSFSGTDDWISGYRSDTWSTHTGDDVYATTDDGDGTWGSGGAVDNHLVYTGDAWSDFTASATLKVSDDDTAGLVFRYVDEENFYIAIFCGGSYCPGTGDGSSTSFTGAKLYKVSAGRATELDSSAAHYTYGVEHDVQIVASGDDLEVWFDDDADGTFEAADLTLTATDSTLPSGEVGFYCYNCGERQAEGCAFDDLVVTTPADTDADGDGFTSTADGGTDCDDTDSTIFPGAPERADGVDNDCDGTIDEGTSAADDDGDGYSEQQNDCDDTDAAIHPDQADVANGIDDDCDGQIDEDAGTDTGGQTTGDDTGGQTTGDDTGTGPGDVGDTGEPDDIGPRTVTHDGSLHAPGGCTCATPGGTAPWGALGLLAGVLLLRRR